MEKEICLSLCIPTNGVKEWVIPVIDSIYCSECDPEEFEVIVTDNGQNEEFEKAMTGYAGKYKNLHYTKTDAKLFQNQIEAFKLANGALIKFVNHRMALLPGALDHLISFAKKHRENEPAVYFSNGQLRKHPALRTYSSFDEYTRALSYWSSWSAGTAIWKSVFRRMDLSRPFNELFPHTDLVFSDRNNDRYIIDDAKLFCDISTDSTKKGNYDLFNAFAVEYPSVIQKLYTEKSITRKTYNSIIRRNGFFVGRLYYEYVIKKEPCSYNLDGFEKAAGKFYSKAELKRKAMLYGVITGITKRIHSGK